MTGSLHAVSRAIGSLDAATKSLGRSVDDLRAKIDAYHADLDTLRSRVDAADVAASRRTATVAGLGAGVGFVSGAVGGWLKGLLP